MKKLIALILTAVLCLCCLASCTLFAKYSITYADKETERLLHDGYVPRRANPGDTVVLRAGPIMDANLYFYANGVQIENTHNDSDYWEYTFIMPDEDVVITHDIIGGFGPKECINHIDENNDGICDDCGHKHTITYVSAGTSGHFENYTCGCPHDDGAVPHYDENGDYICDACGYVMPEHEHTGKWYKNETIHVYEYTCGCVNNDIAEHHVYGDDNGSCVICGYVMPEHEHTYEYNHDDIGHGWSYTCGCMTPPNFAQHFDGDGDGRCDEDSCGYEYAECDHQWDDGVEVEGGNGCYVMDYTCTLCGDKKREHITIIPPENHFLRNQAGCEWLNEITAEDIAKIKIISGAVGVAPGNLNNVSSSTDETVIARIFEEYYWLDTAPISKMEGQIDGGGGVTVKFILKDGTAKELYINNGNYLDTNGDYFELLFTPKFKDTDNAIKAYGFITYLGTGTVYDKDNHSVCEIPIDELEFVESDGCVDAMVTGYYYTVETEFGTLYFDYSNDLFYLQFEEGEVDYIEFYRLVGKNLDELIAEYSITTE